MNKILEVFGLRKDFKLVVDSDKTEFLEFLQQKVKPNRFFIFDIFDGEQKKFYGNVSKEKFWLRKSGKFFTNSLFASAYGFIKSTPNKTELEIKIIGWNWFVIVWFLFMTLIFGLSVNDAIETDSFEILVIFGPLFILFYLFGILKIRNGVKKFERFLVSELNDF